LAVFSLPDLLRRRNYSRRRFWHGLALRGVRSSQFWLSVVQPPVREGPCCKSSFPRNPLQRVRASGCVSSRSRLACIGAALVQQAAHAGPRRESCFLLPSTAVCWSSRHGDIVRPVAASRDPVMTPVPSRCPHSRSRPEIWSCSLSLPFLRRRSGRSRSVNGYRGKPMT
jgi:hypothetical protein